LPDVYERLAVLRGVDLSEPNRQRLRLAAGVVGVAISDFDDEAERHHDSMGAVI
jgi:hypothetical protein